MLTSKQNDKFSDRSDPLLLKSLQGVSICFDSLNAKPLYWININIKGQAALINLDKNKMSLHLIERLRIHNTIRFWRRAETNENFNYMLI